MSETYTLFNRDTGQEVESPLVSWWMANKHRLRAMMPLMEIAAMLPDEVLAAVADERPGAPPERNAATMLTLFSMGLWTHPMGHIVASVDEIAEAVEITKAVCEQARLDRLADGGDG